MSNVYGRLSLLPKLHKFVINYENVQSNLLDLTTKTLIRDLIRARLQTKNEIIKPKFSVEKYQRAEIILKHLQSKALRINNDKVSETINKFAEELEAVRKSHKKDMHRPIDTRIPAAYKSRLNLKLPVSYEAQTRIFLSAEATLAINTEINRFFYEISNSHIKRECASGCTVEKAFSAFLSFYNLDEDDFEFDSFVRTNRRVNNRRNITSVSEIRQPKKLQPTLF